jgi:hypothetical protein
LRRFEIFNYGLEETMVKSLEIKGLGKNSEILITAILRNKKSNKQKIHLENILFNKDSKFKANWMMHSNDFCRFTIHWKKNFKEILKNYLAKLKKCQEYKIELEYFLQENKLNESFSLNDQNLTDEELKKLQDQQIENLEKKFELEEKIKKCTKKFNDKNFRKKKKVKLIVTLSNDKKFEIVLFSRNLKGEFLLYPETRKLEVYFPGPNNNLSFQIVNGFGKDLKIYEVFNISNKLKIFEAFAIKRNIKSSDKPGIIYSYNPNNFS